MSHAVLRVQPYRPPDNDLVGSREGLPLFQARMDSSGQRWAVKCVCGETHTHDPGEGLRRAHCRDPKALGGHSYWLICADVEMEML